MGTKSHNYKLTILTQRFSLLLIVVIFFILFIPAKAISWRGKIIDTETGQPIEGAVVVRSWDELIKTPKGVMSQRLTYKETLSNQKGKFSITGIILSFHKRVAENRTIVYKPGYKMLELKKKMPVIQLEKLPTFIKIRKEEYYKTTGNYQIDVWETQILRDMLEREWEFIESPKPERKLQKIVIKGPSIPSLIRPIPRISKIGKPIFVLKDNPDRSRHKSYKRKKNGPVDLARHPEMAKSPQKVKLKPRPLKYKTTDALINDLTSHDTQTLKKALRILSDMFYRAIAKNYLDDRYHQSSHDRKALQQQARAFIEKLDDPRLGEVLIACLSEQDPRIRGYAAKLLGTIKEPKAAEMLTELLKDDTFRVRKEAFSALVEIASPAVESLIPLLKDENDEIRAAAAYCLGKIKDPRAIDPLIESFNVYEPHPAEDLIIWALTNFKEQRVAYFFTELLKKIEDNRRDHIGHALMLIGTPSVEPLLVSLNDGDPLIRKYAARFLGWLNDQRALELLISALRDVDSKVRGEAIWSLLRLGNTRAIKPLVTVLQDEDPAVRAQAAEALIGFGDFAIEPLLVILQSKESYQRWRAAWILGRIKNSTATEALIRALDDSTTEVKRIAITALGEVGDPRAIESLTLLLNVKDPGISSAAEFSIRRIEGQNFGRNS
jgi:HEAT repeat protein